MKPRSVIQVLSASMLALSAFAAAGQESPIGRWKTIDDATGKPKSIVQMYADRDGSLAAKVMQILDTSKGANPICDKCSGSRKDQPINGMVIAWGLKPHDKEWSDGSILDPENGKTYSVKMSLIDGGKRLKIRGFLGISLLGRTQVWLRE